MSLDQGLTLFTSDSRPKYAIDALNVLALPSGSVYQFRYETKYLPNNTQHAFEKEVLENIKILIAFRSKSNNQKDFIVPLRWGSLLKVKRIADFYIIYFIIQEYPILKKKGLNPDRSQIESISEEYILTQPNHVRDLPVHEGLISIVEPKGTEDLDSWLSIARYLALHASFLETHFLRLTNLTNYRGKKLSSTSGGCYITKEGKYTTINVDYFAVNYGYNETVLKVITDSGIIRIASGANTLIDSRYDSIKIQLQSLLVPGNTLTTEIQIQTSDNKANSPQTKLRIPIEVRKSKYIMISRLLMSTIGASLVAMPSILGTDIDKTIRIIIASIGVLMLSISVNLIIPQK